MRRYTAYALGVIMVSVVVTAAVYSLLPDNMPSHWNMKGEVDGYMQKTVAVSIVPLIALALLGLFIIIPTIDPLKRNIEVFRVYYDRFVLLFSGFLSYLQVLIVAYGLAGFNFVQMLLPALAVLFYYVGVVLEHTKRNWFVGIRTPWTLSSDAVWEKTHKVGGRLFRISVLAMLAGIVLPDYSLWFVVVPLIFVACFTIIYSYAEYRKEESE